MCHLVGLTEPISLCANCVTCDKVAGGVCISPRSRASRSTKKKGPDARAPLTHSSLDNADWKFAEEGDEDTSGIASNCHHSLKKGLLTSHVKVQRLHAVFAPPLEKSPTVKAKHKPSSPFARAMTRLRVEKRFKVEAERNTCRFRLECDLLLSQHSCGGRVFLVVVRRCGRVVFSARSTSAIISSCLLSARPFGSWRGRRRLGETSASLLFQSTPKESHCCRPRDTFHKSRIFQPQFGLRTHGRKQRVCSESFTLKVFVQHLSAVSEGELAKEQERNTGKVLFFIKSNTDLDGGENFGKRCPTSDESWRTSARKRTHLFLGDATHNICVVLRD